MVSYDFSFRFEILEKQMREIKSLLSEVLDGFNQQEALWDNSDMLRYFKISERTLIKWRAQGKISYSKIGGKIYYNKKDIDTFLENNKVYGNECFANKEWRIQ